jgi:hypothetical protein
MSTIKTKSEFFEVMYKHLPSGSTGACGRKPTLEAAIDYIDRLRIDKAIFNARREYYITRHVVEVETELIPYTPKNPTL